MTESQLRALLSRYRGDEGASNVIAVAAQPRWDGSPVLEVDGRTMRVVPCVSSLAVREALSSHAGRADDEILVILTDRPESDLGQEVLARVWQHRVRRLSSWELVKDLFRVDQLDPALADEKWLVELLVDVAPVRGYPPPPSGLLDKRTAWRTFLRHGLRLDPNGAGELVDLLRWGTTDEARQALKGRVARYLDPIAGRVEEDVGSVGPHVLRLVKEGKGSDLIPLGLLCDALWSPSLAERPEVRTARTRFEVPLGSRDLSADAAREWGDAAVAIVRRTADMGRSQLVAAWADRAQELLEELDAIDVSIASDVLPWAFNERLLLAGRRLGALLDEPGDAQMDAVEEAEAFVARHVRVEQDGADRLRRLQMAVRLVRWMRSRSGEIADDLETQVERFVGDGAWVDAAREEIGHGEEVSSLAEAYARLIARVDDARKDRDRAFAEAFAAWNATPPTDPERLLPIEDVLDEVVAPLARQAPVLLLVLDGLSHPEAVQLFGDIRDSGWREQAPEGRRLPYVLAATPTVTNVSRATLLTGTLQSGGQDVERAGFQDHVELREACGGSAPRLFHKKDLKVEHGKIAPEVHQTVLDPDVQVVGVVVNAVDDHLDKGSQLRLAKGLRSLRPLRPLLEAAAEAERAVAIVSDHGHVLEHGSEVRLFAGSGERWRPADEPPGEDEIELTGPRVVRADGRIVAPMVESIRYMSAEKRGYHGGATPQEVLCPLTVITTGRRRLDGWDVVPARRPPWWDDRDALADVEAWVRIDAAEPEVDPDGQGMLFTAEGEVPSSEIEAEGWIEQLLESPMFEEQRQAAGRQALDDESVARFLALLDAVDGVAPSAFLVDHTGLPPSRIRTKLVALSRMLNVDGYAVLRIESDGTARLNRELLAAQFGVER